MTPNATEIATPTIILGPSDGCRHDEIVVTTTARRSGIGVAVTLTCVCKTCGLRFKAPANKGFTDSPKVAFLPNVQTAKPAAAMSIKNSKPKPTFQEKIDSLGPGPGTEGLLLFHEMGMIDCSGCWTLAGRMNREGIDWCRSERGMTFIIEDSLPRAEAFWNADKNGVREKLSKWAASPLSMWDSAKFVALLAVDLASALRMLLERLFTEAINRSETKAQETSK